MTVEKHIEDVMPVLTASSPYDGTQFPICSLLPDFPG